MDIPTAFIQDSRFPATAKDLLGRLRSKDLTLDQFLTECAYWALKDVFDELYPKQSPSRPNEADELENMPEEQKLKLNYNDYWAKNPRIKNYYDQRLMIKNLNWGMFCWLEDMYRYVPEEDIISREKIKNRLMEFRTKVTFGAEYLRNDLPLKNT